jgi:SAM-dependent methyltransferase
MEGSPRVSRCRSCRLLFLSEFPSAAERASYYQDDYYEADSGARFPGPFERLIALFRELRARDISKRLPPRTVEGADAFLDVGCGRGYLLDAFHRRGWRVAGTQLSETAIEACRKRSGLGVLKGELPELNLEGGSFRAVAFYHVLEHLDRPFEYLKEAHRLLRPDGLLVVEVPDAGAPGFRLLKQRDFCLDYPNHLFFFDAAALTEMLGAAGFKVVRKRHFSLEYSPFTLLQNLLNALPGRINRLYRSLMRNEEGRRLRREPLTWLHYALAALLGGPGFLLSLTGIVLPLGNTLRVYCVKGEPREAVLAEAGPADGESAVGESAVGEKAPGR